MSQDLQLSAVIPVYNEEGILREAVTELHGGLVASGRSFEIILAENGSIDATVAIAEHLSEELPEVRMLRVHEPNYGLALRRGIESATGTFVVCDEIDLCDLDFYSRALEMLEHRDAEMVVGSKVMPGANDERPVFRRLATRVINGMLRVAVDFRGTDTHGLKAFRREVVLPVVERCIVDKDIFASELVVRCGHLGVEVVEIPVRVAEKRRPAINLMRRVPGVLGSMAKLTYAIRFSRKP
ncbi:MAG: glycosyltransferase family 2 protein [Deltaproteobacteria bacterium]|nr:glycosyltransferase family 2 protein [Deltaproteobacteria bacterium]